MRAKGNRDRLILLPEATIGVLRRFWKTHRIALDALAASFLHVELLVV